MATCKAVNYAGIVCNQKAENATYFWFYDPCGRLNKVFHLCKLHSNLIIDELMVTENSYSKLIKACFDRIEKLRKELQSGNNLSEQREAIKNARENGNPEPKFKSVMEIKNNISDLYTKVNNSKKILQIEGNKLCRFCKFPLKEPESPKDQIGQSYTPIDFKLAPTSSAAVAAATALVTLCLPNNWRLILSNPRGVLNVKLTTPFFPTIVSFA